MVPGTDPSSLPRAKHPFRPDPVLSQCRAISPRRSQSLRPLRPLRPWRGIGRRTWCTRAQTALGWPKGVGRPNRAEAGHGMG